jgi:hypothetical protein
MLLDEIRLIARERGIKTRNRKKEELIRAILEGEGNGDGAGESACRPAGEYDSRCAGWRQF